MNYISTILFHLSSTNILSFYIMLELIVDPGRDTSGVQIRYQYLFMGGLL